MMKRIVLWMTIGAVAAAYGALGLGCGDGIGTTETAELSVESEVIELSTLAPDEERSRTQPSLELKNEGKGMMEVESVEWIDRPERLVGYHQGPVSEDYAGVNCTVDADCGADGICLTQSNLCRDRGFKSLPESVQTDASFTQSLVLLTSEQAVECPEPPSGEDIPQNYCGAIAVETNALNDDGKATIYIISDGSSGLMRLEPTYMQYTWATPGTTQTLEFTISNRASSPLEMNGVTFQQFETWFDVTPSLRGAIIGGNQSQTFTLEMTPSSNASESDLESMIAATFESSSVATEDALTVEVTAGPGDVPLIEVRPQQLSFDESLTQTLEVANLGNASLRLNDMNIEPSSVEDHYSVTYEDEDGQIVELLGDDPGTAPSVGRMQGDEPTVQQFTVTLDAAADADTTVGELQINHNDSLANNRSTVTLLGEASEVAVGRVEPVQTNLRSDGGPQTRTVVLSNTGNTALEVDGFEYTDVGPNTDVDAFDIQGFDDLSLAPGDIAEATIAFDGESGQFSQVLTVELNSNHAGQSQMMNFNVQATDITAPTMDLEIIPSFPQAAGVDEPTNFEIVDHNDEARVNQASWYLHQRPAGSQTVIDGSGSEILMIPDTAGDYRISVVVSDDDGREVQEIFDFDAQDL